MARANRKPRKKRSVRAVRVVHPYIAPPELVRCVSFDGYTNMKMASVISQMLAADPGSLRVGEEFTVKNITDHDLHELEKRLYEREKRIAAAPAPAWHKGLPLADLPFGSQVK